MTVHKPLTKETFFRNVHDAKRVFASKDDVRSAVQGLLNDLESRKRMFETVENPNIISESHIREIDCVLEIVDEWFPVFAEEKK